MSNIQNQPIQNQVEELSAEIIKINITPKGDKVLALATVDGEELFIHFTKFLDLKGLSGKVVMSRIKDCFKANKIKFVKDPEEIINKGVFSIVILVI